MLGNPKGARLLSQILEEEKHGNAVLNELAHSSLNRKRSVNPLGTARPTGLPAKAGEICPR